MKSIIPYLLHVSLRICSVEAAASFLPATFTGLFWQSTIVVNNHLYIDGGEIGSVKSGIASYNPNYQNFAIDISESWTTSDVTAKVSQRNDASTPSRRPELFYDASHNMIYSYGGQFYGKSGRAFAYDIDPEVWGFTPNTDGSVDWKLQFSEALSGSFPLISNAAFALATSSGKKHYSLGGLISFPDNIGLNHDMVMEQFLIDDYTTQEFENRTRATPHSVDGKAHFVPHYGEEGVLLFFGGKNPLDRGVVELNIADLGNIQVYDIHTDQFYIQKATNPPMGRFRFCSVGASNAQNSSFEIFIYGGSTGSSSASDIASLSKVYILTLPAFAWIEAPIPADQWRGAHACQLIGSPSIPEHNQRQMLSVGGLQEPFPDGAGISDYVESWTSGMKIFDLTELTWGDSYDSEAEAYERSEIVDNFYDSNSGFPAAWGDTALNAIFNNTVADVVANPTTTPTTIATPSSLPQVREESSNIGAIVGGAVGGFCGLAVVGFLLWWFWWRRRASNAATDGSAGPGQRPSEYKDQAELGDTSRRELPAKHMQSSVQEAQELPAWEHSTRYA